jgi:hypothetical protein
MCLLVKFQGQSVHDGRPTRKLSQQARSQFGGLCSLLLKQLIEMIEQVVLGYQRHSVGQWHRLQGLEERVFSRMRCRCPVFYRRVTAIIPTPLPKADGGRVTRQTNRATGGGTSKTRHEIANGCQERAGIRWPLPQEYLTTARHAMKQELFLTGGKICLLLLLLSCKFQDGPQEQKMLVSRLAQVLQGRVGHGNGIVGCGMSWNSKTQQVLEFGRGRVGLHPDQA